MEVTLPLFCIGTMCTLPTKTAMVMEPCLSITAAALEYIRMPQVLCMAPNCILALSLPPQVTILLEQTHPQFLAEKAEMQDFAYHGIHFPKPPQQRPNYSKMVMNRDVGYLHGSK
jgi:Gpi18-like mannosyltransferase